MVRAIGTKRIGAKSHKEFKMIRDLEDIRRDIEATGDYRAAGFIQGAINDIKRLRLLNRELIKQNQQLRLPTLVSENERLAKAMAGMQRQNHEIKSEKENTTPAFMGQTKR